MEIKSAVKKLFADGLMSATLSSPKSKSLLYYKLRIRKVREMNKEFYQFEKHTKTQVFHENLDVCEAAELVCALLDGEFSQMDGRTTDKSFCLKISQKGKVFYSEKAAVTIEKDDGHNRKKQYILPEGMMVPAFLELGIITPEGKIVASKYDKFKQINRFIEFIHDVVSKDKREEYKIVDFGCGKSYLTFAVYHYLTEIMGKKVQIIGLDLKEDVISRCNQTAEKYGYAGLSFVCGDIGGYTPPFSPDMVISLHACDTATDLALHKSLAWDAEYIFAVPCCQHELNQKMYAKSLTILTDYSIVKERLSALATDALRGKLLEYCGYKVQLLEFVDIAHSPKNILIRAQKGKPLDAKKRDEIDGQMTAFVSEFSSANLLYDLIKDEKR